MIFAGKANPEGVSPDMHHPAVATARLAYRDHPVWQKLCDYRVGPEDAAFSFEQRLARENGWSEAWAQQVVQEYRRFCFLAVTGTSAVTPSDAVDQAWHLHLTYTRDYWERFCPQVLGRMLHHKPTAGGMQEQARFFEQYAQTLKRYEDTFGEPAPEAIWPGAWQRLVRDPQAQRIHLHGKMVVSRWQVRMLMLWATLGAVAMLVLFWLLAVQS